MTAVISVLSKIPTLVKELRRVLPNINFHEVQNPENDQNFKTSEILICDFDLLAKHLYDLPNAKWVQGTWAGIDSLVPHIQKNKIVPYTMTRFTGVHFGQIMGEYVLANIINMERNFFQIRKNQLNSFWNQEGNIKEYRVIYDLTIGVLGTGNIGGRIGKILSLMGAQVMTFGRRPELPKNDEYSYVKRYFTKETLPSLLQECDYIVNVLPQTDDTRGLLDNNMLKHCEDKQSVFINIGRGSIISESELLKALNNKWISGAVLDVFENEPLPKESCLWNMEQVFITPHVAGSSRAKDIAEQFKENLNLFLNQSPLPAIIDLTKGY